ncbi:MAG TPA: hypothetical protein VKR54_01025 [Candidatus Babeliales bacterium]|jgi:hypothetical protein|nr:hypothetical protein [Candidatus Babeliales bacterium]
MKKIKNIVLFFMLIMSCAILSSSVSTASDEVAVVVAHGFGGTGGKDKSFVKAIARAFGVFNDDSRHAPDFPDAGGYYSRTVLYTKPAVLVLVQKLNEVIQNGKTVIHLVAHSCGGGTAINMLAKLIDYEKNKDYFEDAGITLAHAQAILAALKRGSINITAPLLTAEKSQTIMRMGAALSAGTCMAACAGLYYAAADLVQSVVGSVATEFGCVAAGLGAYYVLGKQLKRLYVKYGIRYIMPLVSRYNFDPYHPTPLESLDVLEDGIITRVQLCADDEIVHFASEDVEKLRAKATCLQIVADAGHHTIAKSLCNAISKKN